MPAQSKVDCPHCKSNSIEITCTPPTIKGFGINYSNCTVCGYVFTEQDIYDFIESIKAK